MIIVTSSSRTCCGLSSLVFQAMLDAESPAKRTRLQAQDSPSKHARVAAKRAELTDALERDLKQVMNYADEKVRMHRVLRPPSTCQQECKKLHSKPHICLHCVQQAMRLHCWMAFHCAPDGDMHPCPNCTWHVCGGDPSVNCAAQELV